MPDTGTGRKLDVSRQGVLRGYQVAPFLETLLYPRQAHSGREGRGQSGQFRRDVGMIEGADRNDMELAFLLLLISAAARVGRVADGEPVAVFARQHPFRRIPKRPSLTT